MITNNELAQWAERAAQELHRIILDLEEAVPSEQRGEAALNAKLLLAEYEDIAAGQPTWRQRHTTQIAIDFD